MSLQMFVQKFLNKTAKQFIILIAFFLCYTISSSQEIFLKDTSVSVGKDVEIIINSNQLAEKDLAATLKLTLKYNANLLEFKSATGSNTFVMNQDTLQFVNTLNKDNYEDSKLEIIANKTNQISNAPICKLNFLTLVGLDSIAKITPIMLESNSTKIENINFKEASVYLNRIIFTNTNDKLGLASPNPFFETTNIEFTIDQESDLTFEFYNSSGRIVSNLPNEANHLDFKVLDAKGDIVVFDSKTQFKKGNYKLILTPNARQFSAGVYYLFMKSKNSVQQSNLIFAK